MVMDYKELKEKVNIVVAQIDHQELNRILGIKTTAENMVFWIWDALEKDALLKGISKIELRETANANCILTAEEVLRYKTGELYAH